MMIFGLPLFPLVRKILVIAGEKGIEAESRPVLAGDQDEAFQRSSPFGRIPSLTDGGVHLSEANAIIAYLESKYPEPPLLPREPEQLARAVWFNEAAAALINPVVSQVFMNRVGRPRFLGREGDMHAAAAAEDTGLPPILTYLESAIPPSGFLVADRLSLADIAVASPFVNLQLADCAIDAAQYPRLSGYLAEIHARPAFADLLPFEKALVG